MPKLPTILLALALFVSACGKKPEAKTGGPASFDVVLLPTDDVPAKELNWLAASLEADTGLTVKAMLPFGTRDLKPYGDRKYQYDPDAIIALAEPVIGRLKESFGGEVYVIVTSLDIGPSDRSLNFLFVEHDHTRKISVMSAARVVADEKGEEEPLELIRSRLRKILLRTIALQYYELERSANLQEVTYSPLMGVADLDAMGVVIPSK